MSPRIAYLLRRSAQALVVLFITYTVSFLLLTVLPSDPISLKVYGGESSLGDSEISALRAFYGFDRPWYEQYLGRLVALFHGDLGYSLSSGLAVGDRIREVLPYTILLSVLAIGFSFAFTAAIVAGTFTRSASWLRPVFRQAPPVLAAIPSFWLGLLVLQVFSFRLGIIPVVGGGNPATLVAASAVLGLLITAGTAQILIHSIDALYRQPFVEHLRAGGTPERAIFWTHILRGAAASATTVAGLAVAGALTGSVITETIFNVPGVGKLLQSAVSDQDVAVVQAVVLVVAVIFVATNLLIDVLHTWIDPRVVDRLGRKRALA